MNRPKIVMIAAIGNNRGLGYKNKLIFSNKEDLNFFKACTTDNVVIMGRKTFESVNNTPFTNRYNIIVTSQDSLEVNKGKAPYSYIFCKSIREAILNAAKMQPKKTIFIIGGAEIYKQCMPICDEIYISEFKENKKADVFFPDVDDDFYCHDFIEYKDFTIMKYKRFN